MGRASEPRGRTEAYRHKPLIPGTLRKLLKPIFVFHLVCVSWIFFRAQSLRAAWEMLKGLGKWSWRQLHFRMDTE